MNKTLTAAEVAHLFLDYLEAKEIEAFMQLWAEDGVQVNAFASNSIPDCVGKIEIEQQYRQLIEQYQSIRFVERRILPAEDTRTCVVRFIRFQGDTDLAGQTIVNNNVNICLLEINQNGLITSYTEYFNSLDLA